MAKVKGAITVNVERCKGCNLCVNSCPTKTLALQPNEVNDRGYHYAFMANPTIASDAALALGFVQTHALKYIGLRCNDLIPHT